MTMLPANDLLLAYRGQRGQAATPARAARLAILRQATAPEAPRPICPPLRDTRPKGKPSDLVGVGILAFHDLADVSAAVTSVDAHGGKHYARLVFDNSNSPEIATWMRQNAPTWTYIPSPQNVGCWNARNRMSEFFGSKGIEHFIIQDQDVRWVADAVMPMLDVFQHHPDTGCVTWKLAVTTMGKHTWDATGKLKPPESPGMCCMYRLSALLDNVVKRNVAQNQVDTALVGWYTGYGLCFRGDSDVCFALWSKGYPTRVVMEGRDAVLHNHPHRGTGRLGQALVTEQAFSQRVFNARRAKYAWPSL